MFRDRLFSSMFLELNIVKIRVIFNMWETIFYGRNSLTLTMWHIRISIRINTSWNLIYVKKCMFFSGGTVFSFLQRTCNPKYHSKSFDFQDLIFNKWVFFIKKTEMFFYKRGNHFCYWLCNINKLILEQVNFHKNHAVVQRESKYKQCF